MFFIVVQSPAKDSIKIKALDQRTYQCVLRFLITSQRGVRKRTIDV